MSIVVHQLTKQYGNQKALDCVSFEVKKGEILGLLGPNGAGKSTSMKIMTGYIPPSQGSVTVCGYDVTKQSKKVKNIIGYLPEHNPLYLDMYVHEYLHFMASLHHIKGRKLKNKTKEIIKLCGLEPEQKKQIKALSKGYRQRVGLAQAFLHDPNILILDEPTSGLDPNQIVEIRKLIKAVSQNKTVVFSSHIMQEVQAICDRVVILNKGKVVADDIVENIQQGSDYQVISVSFSNDIDINILKSIETITEIKHIEKGQYLLQATIVKDIREDIFKLAASNQWSLLEMKKESQSLESIFQKLTNRADD